jgi:hypothetical protein
MIKKTNDWEYYKYYFNNQEINEKKDGEVHVEFPDGTNATLKYVSNPSTGHYSDHGRQTTVQRYELYAIINHHGMKIRTPIENLLVKNFKEKI